MHSFNNASYSLHVFLQVYDNFKGSFENNREKIERMRVKLDDDNWREDRTEEEVEHAVCFSLIFSKILRFFWKNLF